MSKSLVDLSGSVFSDALSLWGIPASTAVSALHRYVARRAEQARDILIEEVRTGEIDMSRAASEDDAVAVVYRYYLAARDGAARRNLRLLAKAIVGLAQRDRLYSDEFCKHADVLSGLSRDQIFVAGRFYHLRQVQLAETTGSREGPDAWSALKEELVPKAFSTQEHLEAICAQLAGAGLVYFVSVYGGNAYAPSPILIEVAELADFEATLGAEAEL